MTTQLRVLVVDDSAHNRRTITDIFSAHPEMEVVGTADDGEKALKAAAQLKPDLITLDLEMPRMDGFTFLRVIMAQMPTPVIVISSENRKQSVFQVLELGALDFVAKPARYFSADEGDLREQLIAKALAVSALQMMPLVRRGTGESRIPSPTLSRGRKRADPEWAPASDGAGEVERVVCVGASTGGPPALQSLVKSVSVAPSTALVIAQHMPEKFTRAFADRLNRLSALKIQEAETGVVLKPGNAYIAPGRAHTKIMGNGAGRWVLRVFPSSPADRYSPSIDTLFESAADSVGDSLMAVVLTGMGSDGSVGVRAVRAAGGRILAESKETAIVYGMPKEAELTGCVDEVLPIESIVKRVVSFCGGSGAFRPKGPE